MAYVWLTDITNNTDSAFVLRQNDPSWHPVYAGRQYAPDEPFVVGAGQRIGGLSYFLVPWVGYGRLLIENSSKGRSLSCAVGHKDFWSNDFIFCTDLGTGRQVEEIVVGPQGGGGWGPNVEFGLELAANRVNFQLRRYNKGVQDYLPLIFEALSRAAPVLAGALGI